MSTSSQPRHFLRPWLVPLGGCVMLLATTGCQTPQTAATVANSQSLSGSVAVMSIEAPRIATAMNG